MKKMLLAVGLLAMTSAPAIAGSGSTSTATGTATANVVAPVVLSHNSGAALSFGRFTTGTGGSVVVATSGSGSTTADVTFVPGSTTTADAFSLSGDPSRSYAVSTTAGSVSNGSKTMPFTTQPSANTGALNSAGSGSFTVGGTLTVAGNETAGSYTGSYSATVTYN
ncbi:DUF4402 domain-containing protein [Novosphingobium sp. FSY-8]|uniref:DUF4402 domain-containing protein n=1 Tax=Novosphingobium ovatum TaxID=1908523 RepID=A0ABW9XEE8_9SPHN|nr:DUF4402 domain-containing protein [Novosphingobium ovatum]NBC36914.1 DUF4402 domain-containing protein [Novosphingobium ovatum]